MPTTVSTTLLNSGNESDDGANVQVPSNKAAPVAAATLFHRDRCPSGCPSLSVQARVSIELDFGVPRGRRCTPGRAEGAASLGTGPKAGTKAAVDCWAWGKE